MREKLFMVDCGEGTQLQFRKSKLGFGRLNRIFITHLHGDHCFGLIGLISTLGLLGRTGDLFIHSVPGLRSILQPQLDFFCKGLTFNVHIEEFDPEKNEIIYEDKSVRISTIPLHHRVPCAGFLFREQEKERHLLPEMMKYHNVPISEFKNIKKGYDFITKEGNRIPNNLLTRTPKPPLSYAYCSDTAYYEKIIPIIEGVDLLYHEATFLSSESAKANETGHSTAAQAAKIAKAANVKKLILGHFSSRYPDNSLLLEEAKAIFPAAILANENLCEKLYR